MDKKFLNKVIEQIVSETKVHREKNCLLQIDVPYQPKNILIPHLPPTPFHLLLSVLRIGPFTKHCRDVYGLNEEEIEYVWKEYKDIIRDKIYG